jgi:NADPH:quinone reductase-like Zn-dependent oxidoreductase
MKPLSEATLADFTDELDLKFASVLNTTEAALPHLRASDAASVVMGTLTQRGTIHPSRGVVVFWGSVLGAIPSFLKLALVSPFVSQRLGLGREKQTEPALAVLKRLLDEGAVTPLVDGSYPLDQVADAMRHLESGQVCGKIVITP